MIRKTSPGLKAVGDMGARFRGLKDPAPSVECPSVVSHAKRKNKERAKDGAPGTEHQFVSPTHLPRRDNRQ